MYTYKIKYLNKYLKDIQRIPVIRARHKLFLVLWMPATCIQHGCVTLKQTNTSSHQQLPSVLSNSEKIFYENLKK